MQDKVWRETVPRLLIWPCQSWRVLRQGWVAGTDFARSAAEHVFGS